MEALQSAEWYANYYRFVQNIGLRPRTEKCYIGWTRQLSAYYDHIDIAELNKTQVLDFLVYLQKERKLNPSTVNQALRALKTFYSEHLGLKWRIWTKIKIKKIDPLPVVLTREEVERLLSTIRDGRYRAFFTVVYQCGLRLQEALNVKPKDVDGERLVLRVRVTKGGMEREVPITPELLERLRGFWKSHRNPDWLFPGVGQGRLEKGLTIRNAMHECRSYMSSSGIYAALKVAKHECGLMKKHEKVTIHTLRHSFATHMLEGGCSLKQLSVYLGHKDLRSTMVYLHLTEVSETQGRQALLTLATGKRKRRS